MAPRPATVAVLSSARRFCCFADSGEYSEIRQAGRARRQGNFVTTRETKISAWRNSGTIRRNGVASAWRVKRTGFHFETPNIDSRLWGMTAPPPPRIDETGPHRTGSRRSYDEGLDKPGKLINDEPVEVEKETPAQENEAVETPASDAPPGSAVFEDDDRSD
jgi:hypothetical protein